MLGDLYVRAGEKDKATALFAQIADSQYEQGFVAKATAFYKKALKVKTGHEHALLRLAEIAAKQELMADARLYLGQLLQRRRDRGDDVGVAECMKRLAAFEQKDEAPVVMPPPAPAPQPPVLATPEPPPVSTLQVERFEQPEPAVLEEPAAPPTPSEPSSPPEPSAPPEPLAASESPEAIETPEPAPPAPPETVVETASRLSSMSIDLMALLDETPEPEAPAEVVVPPVANVSSAPATPNVPPPDVSIPATVQNVATVSSDANVPSDRTVANVGTVHADMKARFEEMLARSRQARPRVDVVEPQEPHDGRAAAAGDVVAQLEAAALTPSLEFQASAQLGRLLIERGDLEAGIGWLDRAARAPIQVPEHAIAVLYEMADALERMGDVSRALTVLTDIESDVGGYRDVRERLDRLTRAQAGGRGV